MLLRAVIGRTLRRVRLCFLLNDQSTQSPISVVIFKFKTREKQLNILFVKTPKGLTSEY